MLAAKCGHYGAPLWDGVFLGNELRCPWHHARFDVRTGEAVNPPSPHGIATWLVVHEGSRVRTGARRDPAPARAAIRNPPSSVLIVGAGASGDACAEQLRRRGYEGPITLVAKDHEGWPVDGYLEAEHPLQRAMHDAILDATGTGDADVEIAVDGCGMQTYALDLAYLARAFGTLAGPETGKHFEPIRRTPLHDWHAAHGARFVEAGQWLRPRAYLRPGESFDAAWRREVAGSFSSSAKSPSP